MSGFSKFIDVELGRIRGSITGFSYKILASKYNKPFPVTLLPSTIGYYLGLKQGQRQEQLVSEIRALGDKDIEKVHRLSERAR